MFGLRRRGVRKRERKREREREGGGGEGGMEMEGFRRKKERKDWREN